MVAMKSGKWSPHGVPEAVQPELFVEEVAGATKEFPFRAEVSECAPAEVARYAKERGKEYVPAETEIAMYGNYRNFQESDGERLSLWASHPDERVPIQLLGGRLKSHPEGEDAARELCLRALREADEEGALWTPLLDSLVFERTWEVARKAYIVEQARRKTHQSGESQVEAPYIPTEDEVLDRVLPWVSVPQPADDLARLMFIFRSPGINSRIAQFNPSLPAEIIESLGRYNSLELAKNEHLKGEQARLIHEEAVREVCREWKGSEKYWQLPAVSMLEARGFPVPEDLLSRVVGRLKERVEEVESQGSSVPFTSTRAELDAPHAYLAERKSLTSEQLAEYFGPFLEGRVKPFPSVDTLLRLFDHPSWDENLEKMVIEGAMDEERKIQAALKSRNSSEQLLAKVHEWMGKDANKLTSLIMHPNIPVAILRKISENPAARIRLELARSERAVADGEIRSLLLRSSSVDILYLVGVRMRALDNVEEAEFLRLFRKLARKSPGLALSVLEAGSEETLRIFRIPSSDWLLLLGSSSMEVRERSRSVFSRWSRVLSAKNEIQAEGTSSEVRVKSRRKSQS